MAMVAARGRGDGAREAWSSSAGESSVDMDDIFEEDEDGPELGPDLDMGERGELEELGEFLSDRALQNLTGSEDLTAVSFLEVRINTDDIVLRDLGARLPNLSELKLNSSNVLSFRDLGTSFASLTVLWLARSNVHELDGIGSLTSIKELYLAFNEVKDLSPMVACDSLEVLDLEGNQVEEISEAHFLVSCEFLSSLTLEGNPVSKLPRYRKEVRPGLGFRIQVGCRV
ncbi:hypothetical protein T484DRAFT_2882105 [Baffinella frigidus]|nr:hypothetical protein T484DRAFT_2882105 [Cryptophyta sp. CCMP2293]